MSSPAVKYLQARSLHRSVIYDFGANAGLNLPYYLQKADKVVAVEANPVLCEEMKRCFASQVADGSLVVVNCAITSKVSGGAEVKFFIHKRLSVLSQMVAPAAEESELFEEIRVEARNAVDIVRAYGDPFYIKVDVEHCDGQVLADLFAVSIRPPFISAEAHSTEILYLLAREGGYEHFKLVRGLTVDTVFKSWRVKTRTSQILYHFPPHSAGPFGHDLPGRWIGPGPMFQRLVREKTGWKDIHATNDESLATLGFRDWVPATARTARGNLWRLLNAAVNGGNKR